MTNGAMNLSLNLHEPVMFRLRVLSKTLSPTLNETSVHLASKYFFYDFYAATNLC